MFWGAVVFRLVNWSKGSRHWTMLMLKRHLDKAHLYFLQMLLAKLESTYTFLPGK